MTSVIVAPCSGTVARRHERISLVRPIDYDNLPIPTEISQVLQGRNTWFWAFTAGKRNVNLSKGVKHIRRGDYIFFSRKRKFILWCKVKAVFKSKTFADALWGTSEDGSSYEYIVALRRPKTINNFHVSVVNTALNYSEKHSFNGVRRLHRNIKPLFKGYIA